MLPRREEEEDGCYSRTGRKDEGSGNAGSRERAGGWRGAAAQGAGEGWHLYLVWAEDGVDAAQHLFGVFSLGVPTDNHLSGESVGGRREKAESCDCTHTTAKPPPCGRFRKRHMSPCPYLFEGVMEHSGGPGHLWQGYWDLPQPL